MHSYLRAIGFSNIQRKKEARELADTIMFSPEEKEELKYSEDSSFHTFEKRIADDIGVMIQGEWDNNEMPEVDAVIPLLYGRGATTDEGVDIEFHSAREELFGVCEDMRVEIALIFYIQNIIPVRNLLVNKEQKGNANSTTLSGLSLGGMILFPVNKDKLQIENSKKMIATRNNLVARARKGDERAMESLTLSDMDTYSDIARRIVKEDVYSLVDSYFMPFGVETDKYSIMGEIIECKKIVNPYSGEEVFKLRINCSDLEFDICINREDLLGEPAIGRRFKGNIWLQGRINL